MPINTENNNKTETVKFLLTLLVVILKKLELLMKNDRPYAFRGMFSPFRKEMRALEQGIQVLESIQFKSVDDLDSVKKLRVAELFFSKNDVLKNYTFSRYKLQINPAFLVYVNIEIQLDALVKKSEDLFYRGHHLAANEAKGLIFDLKDLNRWYFEEKRMDYDAYQSKASIILQKARPALAQHRGYKSLLGNLSLLIGTLGMAFIVNKCVSGRYLFFQKTDSVKQLDEISQAVDSAVGLSV